MSGQLTGSVGKEAGTVPLATWVRRYADKAQFENDHLICGLPASKAALLLRDITIVPGPSNVIRFTVGGVTGLSEGILKTTPNNGEACIPLGIPTFQGSTMPLETRLVLFQTARDIMTAGTNSGQCKMGNVICMYYNVLQVKGGDPLKPPHTAGYYS